MHQLVKCRQNRSSDFLKYRNFSNFQDGGRRHLGFVLGVLDHTQKLFGGLYHYTKCGCDQCSSFDNMKLSIYWRFWLGNAYSHHKN